VMSAQKLEMVNGLVAINSLMAMVGGTLAALIAGRDDPSLVHNGSMAAQLIGTLGGVVVAFVGGYLIYSAIRQLGPLRLDAEEEYEGADLIIHKVSSSPDRESHW